MTTVDYAALLNAAENVPAETWALSHNDGGHVELDAKKLNPVGASHGAFARVVWRMDDDKNIGRNSPECEARAAFIVASQPSTIIQVCADRKALLDRTEALEKALTPSAETKAAYMGEVSFNLTRWTGEGDDEETQSVAVPWTTIKEIMAMIYARSTLSGESGKNEH